LSIWIFPEHSSLIMVFFTVLSCVYIVQKAIKIEEDKERSYKSELWILKEHSKLLIFLLFLFIGFVFSFSLWALFLPEDKLLILFSLQNNIVEGIRSGSMTGNAITGNTFFIIISNNFKVLIFSLVLAFFYGAGSIFVLSWNASVMGFVIGDLARGANGLISLPIAFAKYFLHGIPEMLAYITMALAGGIIYTAVWKGDLFKFQKFKKLTLDVFVLMLISVLLLFLAAAIEVYVSPFV
ncbi:MAG: stage II sporulation protein M, partial [Nanoarchaeota archaeon]|nr:stage II sporulation protein M [Nanoarchaeota archaeon]